jgi:hypothetical protein
MNTIQSVKNAVPATTAMIKSRLKSDCSHTSALDIIATARGFTDYNTLKGLSTCPLAPLGLPAIQNLLTEASAVANYLARYDIERPAMIAKLKTSLTALAKGTPAPDELNTEHSAQEIAAHLLAELEQAVQTNTFHYSVLGADEPSSERDGVSRYIIEIEMILGDTPLDVRYVYSSNEYVGREEIEVSVSMDGCDIEDTLCDECDDDDKWGVDIINDEFLCFAERFENSCDIDNPHKPHFQAALAVVQAIQKNTLN